MTPPPADANDEPQDRDVPDTSDDRGESESEKLDRNWDELLQELRITQTGLQLLSGFLLTLPFTQLFPSLDHGQKALYLGLVVVAGVAVGVNMTPIMLHRRVFREHRQGPRRRRRSRADPGGDGSRRPDDRRHGRADLLGGRHLVSRR